ANALRFLPIAQRSYTIRHARVVVIGADDSLAERVTSVGSAWDFAYRGAVKPQHVAFKLTKPTQAKLTLAVRGATQPAVSIDLSGLDRGWHWQAIAGLGASDGIRATISDAKATADIADLRIAASPLPTSGKAPARLAVSYPLHGECVGPGAYIRGFTNADARLVVDARPASEAPSAAGDFALAVPLGAGANRTRATAVELVAETPEGQRAFRAVSVGPCLDSARVIADVTSPTRKHAIRDDAGAPFGAVVTPGDAKILSFGGATLEIPKGAVDREVRITIRPLVASQV